LRAEGKAIEFVAMGQIDARSGSLNDTRTFDGLGMEQSATQITRKVAWAGYRSESGTAQAIQCLPKGCLNACFGTQGTRMIHDVD
jgi:hypothetical protein